MVCGYVFEFRFLGRVSRRCRRIKKRGGGIIAFSFLDLGINVVIRCDICSRKRLHVDGR
jgi:hypothetical protein